MSTTKYRRNLLLISIFIGLITVALGITLFFGYLFTQKLIENKFNSDKSPVLDSTIALYNDFVFSEIPQISLYKGFLDSSSVSDLTQDYFGKYPFIEKVLFYDVEISNQPIQDGFTLDKFTVGVKAVYQFTPGASKDSTVIFQKGKKGFFSIKDANDLSRAVLKFTDYVASLDQNVGFSEDDIFKVFYTFFNDYISYINVPREADLRIYNDLMYRNMPPSPKYDQDVITFKLNPLKLPVNNVESNLFQHVSVRPVYFDSLANSSEYYTTTAPLPGSLGEYMLYFVSSKQFLNRWIITLFAPLALLIIVVYGIVIMIGLLIYRNLNVNQKMFKLQYDFINNISHEFKTPVSVIKIAGSNMKNSSNMPQTEIRHYGKILDEEADKLNNLMTKLLSITQLENKTIQFKKEIIHLGDFCESITHEYSIKHPDFKLNYNIKGIKNFETDPIILGSLFQNLIENAYKYNESTPKKLNISIEAVKKGVEMSFQDNGIGIALSEQQNIFEKFYRVNNSFNQSGSAGIGLAFCREMVKFMNGRIQVESESGKGTKFTLIFNEK